MYKTFTIRSYPHRDDMVLLDFPYDPELQEQLKIEVPGCHYTPNIKRGIWAGPRNMLHETISIAQDHWYKIVNNLTAASPTESAAAPLSPKLFPYQVEAANRALTQRRLLIALEMGLGKTPTAIEVMRTAKCKTALIICPASVRIQWERELDSWWPKHPPVLIVENSKISKSRAAPIIITSYELAKNYSKSLFDAVIVDESHYVQNRKSYRSRIVAEILQRQLPTTFRLLLTGTPVMNEPWQLWHQLNCLVPANFGSFGRFCDRYTNIESNSYHDWIPTGTNPEHAEELKRRLESFCLRATKTEWAHLLPPFVCSVVPLRVRRKSYDSHAYIDSFVNAQGHISEMERVTRRCTNEKLDAALQYIYDLAETTNKIVILSHLKVSGHEIAANLREHLKDFSVHHIDGDLTTRVRHNEIAAALKSEKSILVSTMHAVKEGINDLARFDHMVLAELYWSPGIMSQVIARAHRATDSCNLSILVLEGSHEEAIAESLKKKLGNIKKIIKQGMTEQILATELDNCSESDADILESLKATIG